MRVLGIIILLFTFSCVSTSKVMNAWIGHDKPTLVQTWGPPQEVADDGQEGEIYIYRQEVNVGQSEGRVRAENKQILYTNPKDRVYKQVRMFYINKDGVIYHMRWEG